MIAMLYRVNENELKPLEQTTFEREGLKERSDLQNMLKAEIGIIAPRTLVVAEEFGDWEDSRRRIDLLGIDKNANLIVIELKRTRDGGHMELQALRYAAMVSTMTFDKLVDIYTRYLVSNDIQKDAKESLLEFLEWDEPDDERFAQEVKIILVSADFSKELTTSVMWLNDFGLDIRCVRLHPYVNKGEVIVDVQSIIPLPEAIGYQVQIREKRQREREARSHSRDLTKFDVSIAGQMYKRQNKRRMMLQIISGILHSGETPQRIIEVIPRKEQNLFRFFDGTLDSDQFRQKCIAKYSEDDINRYFISDNELFHIEGKTYAFTNQWGKTTIESVEALRVAFPELNIHYEPTDEV